MHIHFHHLHGAGCLPVNSAMTRQNPQYQRTRKTTSVIYAPPHRGIHHAKLFLTKQRVIRQHPI
ncbi:hypothetical protein C7B16_10600 [Escherichia sp. 20412-1]|nr:hypothetical protein C7B16_10600 [Escherichia sp. 20412-1]